MATRRNILALPKLNLDYHGTEARVSIKTEFSAPSTQPVEENRNWIVL
jgi:hypothetical protein